MLQVEVGDKIINVYEMTDIDALVDKLRREITWKTTYKYDADGLRHRVDFANYPISFDIETSSFYNDLDGHFYTNDKVEELLDKAYDKEYQSQLKRADEATARRKATIKKVREKDKYQQRACMYIWQVAFGTNDTVVVGRTWGEFLTLLYDLKFDFNLDENKKMIIYDFNYHYEFGFIKNYFTWDLEQYGCLMSDRVTYYTNTAGIYKPDPEMPTGVAIESFKGFMFKDALILAGVKEEKLPKIMNKYGDKATKLVGNLDYDKVRHSKTPLTNDEYAYCIYDVILCNWYIREKMEEYGSIVDIPMTKTDETRIRVRNDVLYTNPNIKSKKDSKFIAYRNFLDKMKIDFEQYQMIRRAYAGGFTHANYSHAFEIFYDQIMSADLASSYPSVMVSKMYAMGPYKTVDVPDEETLAYYLENYACLFDVHFHNIEPRNEDGIDYDLVESIISISKLHKLERGNPLCAPDYDGFDENNCYVNNNGRLRHAKDIYMTINEIDFMDICHFYTFESVDIDNFHIAKKGYLPKDLIKAVLKLFEVKTKYKPFDGTDTKEGLEYARSKVDINGLYGMISTDPLKMSYTLDNTNGYYELITKASLFDDDDKVNKMLAEQLSEKLDGKKQFLCYQWSHTLTSWARHNLFQAIEASGYNHVYSDTDSEKFIKNQKTLDFIKEYNENVDKEMNACFEYYGLPKDSHKAKIPGTDKYKCLGYFEIENHGECYKRFVTAGAKRYLTETSDGELHLTVAGLNKKSIDYMVKKYGKDGVFEHFSKGDITVDREHTGKLAATYIDFSTKGEVIDYLGIKHRFCELSSVHLEKIDFDMHLTDAYEKLTTEGRIFEGL